MSALKILQAYGEPVDKYSAIVLKNVNEFQKFFKDISFIPNPKYAELIINDEDVYIGRIYFQIDGNEREIEVFRKGTKIPSLWKFNNYVTSSQNLEEAFKEYIETLIKSGYKILY